MMILTETLIIVKDAEKNAHDKRKDMSGLAEIQQWIQQNYRYRYSEFKNAKQAYDIINNENDWRTDLDYILGNDKQNLIDWLDTKIPKYEEPEPRYKEINVRGYQYVNYKGNIVTVKSYIRRILLS